MDELWTSSHLGYDEDELGDDVGGHYPHGGKPSLYVRDFGNGRKIFTFVVWADTK